MNGPVETRIELAAFSNRFALEMGSAIIELAKSRGQHVAIQIERLNQPVFLYIDDSLPPDKHNWLKRKANVARHFEESSLRVKQDLLRMQTTLEDTFALPAVDFLAKGGAIPIFVAGVGMVGIITVSGLHDEEDHKIILDALKQMNTEAKKIF